MVVTWDLHSNVSSQCFTIWIFCSQKAWGILAATALAPTGTSKKCRSNLSQKETAKQQLLLSLDVWQGSWYNLQSQNNWTCQFVFNGNPEPNLTLWYLTCWDLQLFDVHKDKRQKVTTLFSLWLNPHKMQRQPGLATKLQQQESHRQGAGEMALLKGILLVCKKKSKILQQTHHRSLYESQGEVHKQKPLRCS